MDLFCRNPKCEYFSRPIPSPGNTIKCPSCGYPLLGGSVLASGSVDVLPPERPNVEPPKRQDEKPPAAKPPAAPGPKPVKVENAEKRAKSAHRERPAIKPSPSPSPSPSASPGSTRTKADDPNLTRPFGGSLPSVLGRKPRFVLELIENGRADPMDFIDETRETPLYSRDLGYGQRHLANLRSTDEGVELTPIDSHSRFFVQIRNPVRLTTGSRFRIGDFVIEARISTEPASGLDPDGNPSEPLSPKELFASGELVFLRANGSDGLRFPVLRNIVIGRGGPGDPHVDIPLRAPNVSRKHAAVGLGTHGLKLKNLSRHGTFVESRRPKILVEGDRFHLGEDLWQLVRYSRPVT